MRVGIITQYHDRISWSIAESLSANGHDVKIMSAAPSKDHFGVRKKGYVPRGMSRNHPIQVLLVPSHGDHSQSALKRISSYLGFAASSLRRAMWLADCDVVYVYATQMTAGIAADYLWTRSRIPFVLHVQDVWPDSVVESGMVGGAVQKRIAGTILGTWVTYMYRRAAAVIAISPEMKDLIVSRGAPVGGAHWTYNWADEDTSATKVSFRDAELAIMKKDGVADLVYAGNMGQMQDLDTLINALSLASEPDRVHLWMVGDGVLRDALQKKTVELGLKNVTFTGTLAGTVMDEMIEAADFLVVPLIDRDIFHVTVPSKVQGALSRGKPVITSVPGAVSHMVQSYGLGFSVMSGNAVELANAINSALLVTDEESKEMGARGREFYDKIMAESVGTSTIERVLEAAADAAKSRKRPRK